MKATLMQTGEVREFRPGEPLGGHGFTSVELTYEDIRHPHFPLWFNEVVVLKLVPTCVKKKEK